MIPLVLQLSELSKVELGMKSEVVESLGQARRLENARKHSVEWTCFTQTSRPGQARRTPTRRARGSEVEEGGEGPSRDP